MRGLINMFTCNICYNSFQNNQAFVGNKNNQAIFSCIDCFLKALKPFEFDGELVYYPMFGTREIQIHDIVVFFDKDGQELGKVFLKTYEEGLLSLLKMEIAEDLGIGEKNIVLVIEPFDIKIRTQIIEY